MSTLFQLAQLAAIGAICVVAWFVGVVATAIADAGEEVEAGRKP